MLRLPPATAPAAAASAGSVLLQRPRGGPGPRVRSNRAVAQRPAFRFLCRQPLGRAGARSHRKRDDRCTARHRRLLRGIRRFGAVRAASTTCVARCGVSKRTTPAGRPRAHRTRRARLHARPAPRSRAARQLHGAGIVGGRRGSSQRGGRGIRSGNGDRHEGAGTRRRGRSRRAKSRRQKVDRPVASIRR